MRSIEIVRDLTPDQRHAARILWHQVGNRVALMEAQGCSPEQCDKYVGRVLLQLESGRLDEGVLDMLGGFLQRFADSSLSQGLKGMLGDKLVSMIGLDRNSFLGGIISNFVENTTATDLITLFAGGDKCKIVATRLAGALQEQIIEKLITGPMGAEGSTVLGKTIIEAIKAQFVEGGPIVKAIVDFVCGMKISDLLPGVTGSKSMSDLGARLKSAITGATDTATKFATGAANTAAAAI